MIQDDAFNVWRINLNKNRRISNEHQIRFALPHVVYMLRIALVETREK